MAVCVVCCASSPSCATNGRSGGSLKTGRKRSLQLMEEAFKKEIYKYVIVVNSVFYSCLIPFNRLSIAFNNFFITSNNF